MGDPPSLGSTQLKLHGINSAHDLKSVLFDQIKQEYDITRILGG